MITVEKRDYKEYPDWVKKCPHCQNNDLDAYIEISSDSIYAHFALCKSCRIELSKKLILSLSDEGMLLEFDMKEKRKI